MNIKKLFRDILEDAPTNAISGMGGDGRSAIEKYDPVIRLRKNLSPQDRMNELMAFSGPLQIRKVVGNSLRNENKPHLNPLEFLKKDPTRNTLAKKVKTDRKSTKGLVPK